MHSSVFNYITENRNNILERWIKLMKEDTDERLVNVVSDRMFL